MRVRTPQHDNDNQQGETIHPHTRNGQLSRNTWRSFLISGPALPSIQYQALDWFRDYKAGGEIHSQTDCGTT